MLDYSELFWMPSHVVFNQFLLEIHITWVFQQTVKTDEKLQSALLLRYKQSSDRHLDKSAQFYT